MARMAQWRGFGWLLRTKRTVPDNHFSATSVGENPSLNDYFRDFFEERNRPKECVCNNKKFFLAVSRVSFFSPEKFRIYLRIRTNIGGHKPCSGARAVISCAKVTTVAEPSSGCVRPNVGPQTCCGNWRRDHGPCLGSFMKVVTDVGWCIGSARGISKSSASTLST